MKVGIRLLFVKSLNYQILISRNFSYLGNLAHWKEVHPEQEVIYKCQELDRTTQQPCHFTSKESEDIFKHRSKHKIRETPQEVKPEATIE